jgi:hypothetical protein
VKKKPIAAVMSMSGVIWLWQGGSSIQSNSNLGMYGQGLLSLIGLGDCIKAQRLFLSLFYQIYVSIIFVNFVFALFMVHSLYAKRRSDKRGEQVFCR